MLNTIEDVKLALKKKQIRTFAVQKIALDSAPPTKPTNEILSRMEMRARTIYLRHIIENPDFERMP